MKRLFTFFIENYKLSFAITLIVILAGVIGLSKLKSETYPPVDFPRVQVTTIYPGSSPEEVEEQITRKIEEEIRSVAGLKDVRSVSQSGRSEINVQIDMDNYDVEKVVDDLQRAVQKVQNLPKDILSNPNFLRLKAEEIPIFELAVIGSYKNRMRDKLIDRLKTIFEDVKGVSTVRLSGYRDREFQILLDRSKMKKYYVGIEEVSQAVRKRAQNIPAGYLRSSTDQRLVRVTGQVSSAEEMGEIVIRSNFSGQKIKVKDVAEVRDGAEEPSVLANINGKPATLITVSKKASADTILTVQSLKKKLDEFKEDVPEGIKFFIFNDESERVDKRLQIVVSNALGGLALVLIILFIFLPGVLGFVTSMSLPLAIFGAMSFMGSMHINFNVITMLALVIAIGMLVDNSVVISENYARLRQAGMNKLDASVKAAHQFWLPITATVLTTVAAFMPMLVTKGVLGEFIMWIPIVVSFTLLASLFESFFLLPARLRFTISDKAIMSATGEKKVNWFDKIKSKFQGFMYLCLQHRYIVLSAISFILISSTAVAIFGNRFELFPKEQVEFYIARFEAPITMPIESTSKISQDISNRVLEKLTEKNVKFIISRAGVQQAGIGDAQAKNGDYVGMLRIVIPQDRAKVLDVNDVLLKLRSIKDDRLNSLTFDAQRNGPPVGKPITVTFRSENYKQMRELVDKFKVKLLALDGVLDLYDDEILGGPEYIIDIDYDKVSSLGLSTQAVGTALRTALQGSIASELTMDNKDFDLRVRYNERDRESIEALKATSVMTTSNGGVRLIPLAAFSKIKQVKGPSVRKRYDFQRAVTITGEVEPEKLTSIQANLYAKNLLKDEFKSYSRDVSWKFGGEEESTRDSIQSLFQALILAVLGIFSILIFLFRSYSVPFLILTSIPLSLVGVNIAFFVHQKPLSFFALIGVLGLSGVVINSAIVLVSYIEELKSENKLTLNDILARASSDRLRAVLVTSLTTVGGLMPTAYGIGGEDPILVPMTLALAWGLLSGTFLTLIWVPCGYLILQDIFALKYIKRFFDKIGGNL